MDRRVRRKREIVTGYGLSSEDRKNIVSEIEYSNFRKGKVVEVTDRDIDNMVRQLRCGATACTDDMKIVEVYLKKKRGIHYDGTS